MAKLQCGKNSPTFSDTPMKGSTMDPLAKKYNVKISKISKVSKFYEAKG